MKERISRIEERLKTVKGPDEFKRELSSFCGVIAESFDLEMCTVLFFESNPILPPFAVSFPPVDYEQVGLNEIEVSQSKDPKRSVLIPIEHKKSRTGAIILVKKPGTAAKEINIDRLTRSSGVISEIIKKMIGLEIKARLVLVIQRLISYKKKIENGQEKNHRVIFELLSFIVSPIHACIAACIGDGYFVFYNVSSRDGKPVDISHGVFKESQLEFFLTGIKKDEPWTAEIDLKDHGRLKGKMIVNYEKCGSFVDDDIQKILKAIGYNFARLVLFNYIEKSGSIRLNEGFKKD